MLEDYALEDSALGELCSDIFGCTGIPNINKKNSALGDTALGYEPKKSNCLVTKHTETPKTEKLI